VVGVAFGCGFTLAVTDAGVVFSFGSCREGGLGRGSLEIEVLPRKIEALAQTGQRFVNVAAGHRHALALTEGDEVNGWGHGEANGHRCEERNPQRVAALIGQHVKVVGTGSASSYAVTEKGELFTWGVLACGHGYVLDRGVRRTQATPKREEALVGARIAAVAMGIWHTLAADEDGVVWAVGKRQVLGIGGPNPEDEEGGPVRMPTSIPTLRVRVLLSP